MFYHHPTRFKNACALMITVDTGSFAEPKNFVGYTHIAEHLMFSGTRRYSKAQLMEKFDRAFDHIEATTSREQVKLFCTFDHADTGEVVDTLYQILFRWRCSAKQWKQEKEWLLQEITGYQDSELFTRHTSVMSLLLVPQHPVMGTLGGLKKMRYSDVQRVQKYWRSLLANTERSVVLIGPFTRHEQRKISRLFEFENGQERYSTFLQTPTVSLKKNLHTFALILEAQPHAYNLLWDRVLYFRCKASPSGYWNTYTVLKDRSIFSWHDSEKINSRLVKDLLFKPITEKEFTYVKDIFLKYMRSTLDVINPVDSLHWFSGFQLYHYAPWPTTDPVRLYHYFQKLSYADFLSYVDDITKKIK